MVSDEVEALLISLGRKLTELRFRSMPETAVLDLLCEANDSLDIHLALHDPLPISTESPDVWQSHVVTARLESDSLCDWEGISYFSRIRELELVITSENDLDDRDLVDMQLALLNLPQLRLLTINVTKLTANSVEQVSRRLIFPGSAISCEIRKQGRRKKRERPAVY